MNREIIQAALNYIRHVGANHVMRGQPHPQQWIVDGLERELASQPEERDSVRVPRGVLLAISDELHRAEVNNYVMTERGDYCWQRLTEILYASEPQVER